MPESAPPVVVALVRDLFFGVRIEDTVRALGARAELVEDTAGLRRAIARWPALVLIDLAAADDWEEVVRRAKNSPQTRSIPIIAFGSHVDTGALRAARAAGCDHAWARSRFMAELPALIQVTLHPPTLWVEGWDGPPPLELQHGVEQFNRGEYWECHETLERLWLNEPRPIRDLYQGILQVGVAFHHLRAGNYAGTIKMLQRGLPRLRGLPAVCLGVPVAELMRAAALIHEQVIALGPEGIGSFDLASLPQIRIVKA
jgi:uncharacterized protein